MVKIYLHTGSNMGNKVKNMELANQYISDGIGEITRTSNLYKTEAWGKEDQDFFINQALEVETALDPFDVLDSVLEIENKMGRVRKEKWGQRLIDIDILFYANWIVSTKHLVIPHPFLQDRNFVLTPLNELVPGFIHPVKGISIKTIFKDCPDKLEATIFNR
jgi:2-amino-4-hydroxy-6-hydroxymethyldihydropteridine diphosphokinase